MKQLLRSVLATLALWFSFLILTIFYPTGQNIITYIGITLTFTLASLFLMIGISPGKKKLFKPIQLASPTSITEMPTIHRKTDSAQDIFQKTLHKSVSYAKRKHKVMALLFIHANDGDEPLDEMAREVIMKQITQALRTEDLAVPLENDEFAVLLGDIGQAKFAGLVAEKILKSFAVTDKVDTSPSIGVSLYPEDGDSAEKVLFAAESALFEARQTGKGAFQFFSTKRDMEAREFLKLYEALKVAIPNNQLSLHYQPKLDIKKGAITSVEALIRWEHPTLGLLSPAQFIPLAEETGLMIDLGKWLLERTCRDNRFWQTEGYEHVTTSLNLSPIQFRHPDMIAMIQSALQAAQLSPQYLELEINEETVMGDVSLAQKRLVSLKETGVRISIDHFGTGYTSVSHLKHFPINAIKIDKSYIKGIPDSPDDTAITDAFIALSHHLGFEVIAEGVETAEQLQHLSQQHCDMVQGYLLGPPLPVDKISEKFNKFVDHVLP